MGVEFRMFPFKIRTDKVVFMSDLHLGHEREFLWGKRGFSSREEHDSFIFNQWAEKIDPETTVFNLGDPCFNDADCKKFTRLAQLPCKVHYFICGNHHSGSKQAYQSVKGGRFFNVEFLGGSQFVYINGKGFDLCHFPKRIWEDISKGAYHLSGHSHGSDPERNLNSSGRCLDVGVENALKYDNKFFFTLSDIFNILSKKTNPSYDHH